MNRRIFVMIISVVYETMKNFNNGIDLEQSEAKKKNNKKHCVLKPVLLARHSTHLTLTSDAAPNYKDMLGPDTSPRREIYNHKKWDDKQQRAQWLS